MPPPVPVAPVPVPSAPWRRWPDCPPSERSPPWPLRPLAPGSILSAVSSTTSPTAPTEACATVETRSLALRAPPRAASAPASANEAPASRAADPARAPACTASPAALGRLRASAIATCTRTSARMARPMSVSMTPASWVPIFCRPFGSFTPVVGTLATENDRFLNPLSNDPRLREPWPRDPCARFLAPPRAALPAPCAPLAADFRVAFVASLADPREPPFALLADPLEELLDELFAALCFLVCFAMCSTPNLCQRINNGSERRRFPRAPGIHQASRRFRKSSGHG